MPDWAITLLTGGAGVLISLIITFVFNGIVNLPKKKKQQQEEADKKLKAAIDTVRDDYSAGLQSLMEKLEELHQVDSGFQKDLDELKESTEALKAGLQATIKNELKVRYEYWINAEYASMDARDDLEKMYSVYHRLGANGVMDGLRAQFLALPLTPPTEKTEDKE